MDIYPAIDIRGSRCVRLRQGDYAQETVFADDPLDAANRWIDEGATHLHVVDLDAARGRGLHNRKKIAQIARYSDLVIQVGGGIRSEEVIRELAEAGVSRMVAGTQAVTKPKWFNQMCETFPQKMVLGMDTRHNEVMTQGWTEGGGLSPKTLLDRIQLAKAAGIVYTDIGKDGMMLGPDIGGLQKMHTLTDCPIIASGGISTMDDVRAILALPVGGMIIGRAFYEGTITLSKVLKAF